MPARPRQSCSSAISPAIPATVRPVSIRVSLKPNGRASLPRSISRDKAEDRARRLGGKGNSDDEKQADRMAGFAVGAKGTHGGDS